MNDRNEINRIMILNTMLMYFIMVLGALALMLIRNGFDYMNINKFTVFINPLVFALTYNFVQRGRIRYETHSIENTRTNNILMHNFLDKRRASFCSSADGVNFYLIKNNFSLFKLRIAIKETPQQIELTASRVVFKDVNRICNLKIKHGDLFD